MQAERVTPWVGGNPGGSYTLQPGQALVEVSMDPNAHGPEATGFWDRKIWLKTSTGQVFQFEVQAMVVK